MLSQTFATTPGQAYTLSCDVGAFSYVNRSEQRLQITAQGGSQTALLNQTVAVFAAASGSSYAPQSFQFVADSSSVTLVFRDLSTSSQDVDLLLDNIRLLAANATGPAITAQPASRTVPEGAAVTVSVSASGSAPLTYQWLFNGSPIGGATSASYVIAAVQPIHVGSYAVVVKNGAGSVTSTSAVLSLQPRSDSQAQLVSNGSFEAGFDAWSTSGYLRILSGRGSDGSYAVQFNHGQNPPNAVLSQIIATSPGDELRPGL